MYFKNIISNIRENNYEDLKVLCYQGSVGGAICDDFLENRFLERYRDINFINESDIPVIMHSSYYRVSKGKNVRNVLSVYDFLYEKFETNPVKRKVHEIQKKHAIENADGIICISESTKKDFLEYYPKFDHKNIFVTHLSHSSEFNLSSDFDFKMKFEKPYAIYVGMRSKHKNFESCVKAIGVIPNVNLLIVGGGQFTSSEKILLNKYLRGRYTHKINVTSGELSKYYQFALCLLYPSIYEGFGIPILEAMASGCAVISSNSSSMPEVANFENAILLENPCKDALVVSVNEMLDYHKNLHYVNQGLDNVKRFSWNKTTKETIEIYNKIAKL